MKRFEHGGDIYSNSVRLDFSSNINPLGMPEAAIRAITENIDALSRYPDARYFKLRCAIAEKEGIDAKRILCGNGAAELIFSIVRAVAPKRALLIAPTFSEYERALKSVGADIKYYALNEENGFELTERFLDFLHDTDMVFICNPNNPAGNIVKYDLMDKIISRCRENGITAVVDECFMDFAEGGYSVKDKTVVIKAFTKFYSMAGLRLGYMIGDSKIIEEVKNVMPAWSVNAAAETAAIAALSDSEYTEKTVKYIAAERNFLTEELIRLGFKTYNSQVNFVLFKSDTELYEPLLKKGILIRKCDNFRGLDGRFYRTAIKRHEENTELIKALEELV